MSMGLMVDPPCSARRPDPDMEFGRTASVTSVDCNRLFRGLHLGQRADERYRPPAPDSERDPGHTFFKRKHTMTTIRRTISAAFTLACCAAAPAFAGNNIDLVYNGIAIANPSAPPDLQAFRDWCATSTIGCIPTVQQTLYDPTTGVKKGTVAVWATLPFNGGPNIPSSFCFSEFMVFTLDGGTLYAHSTPNGTCGGTIDPALKAPKYPELGTLSVIAGGGDGVLAGGTGKFKNATGTFTDRVFVGFGAPTSGVGGIVYYDQLWFMLMPN